ncbi:T9SS type B sorting domain-containing protein [Chryseobacterium sp. MDT2-18]|uniref:T9SS type B sorting domain-containing protein n=1 Tax=Chryseobacterium sp. MDT2-18 TaxID=1259136 RepID=UPI0027885D0F|nr:T9SS type B sorting domain-containing protein [Chryseobacterium sp. MDT2-18]MDQ0475693.1 gliding motility-associated-like protein [Chryseobacterium sp. MDT2-18]
MKKLYLFLFLGLFSALYAQTKISDTTNYLRNGMFENAKGKIITDHSEKIQFLKERNRKIQLEQSHLQKGSSTAVEMCTNGGFEQVETINGKNFIKNFLFNIGDPPGPTQCKSLSNSAVNSIPQYNPGNSNLMASSVPANLFDRYMGDLKAFDQYALKINYENSGTYGSIVQGQRFKTNNENFLKFNYKAVLQSVYDDSHRDNQPFFKARIINKNKVVVSEFCLVGDEKNCIFTKVSDGGSWYVTLYTEKWQSGILDISSIPNNEEFTVEFMASRCGLGGHFGYAYVDDICLLQSNESFVGSVTLDPLYAVCPTLPVTVCGNYTLPNSGGVTSTLKKLTLKVYDENGSVVHTTTTTSSLDPITKKFCFTLLPQNFPNISTGNYNVGVTADFDVGTSSGGNGCGSSGNTQVFASASDPDANDGWDISFLNCSSGCNIQVNTAKISKCDANHDGKEDFNLTDFNAQVVNSTTGFTFNYFKDYNSAFNNTGAITNFTAYNSSSAVIYVRVSQSAGCHKIIPANLEVRNPTATISGILNVCSGSTELKASAGSTYLWSTGETSQNIIVTSIGVYSVTVTDSFECFSMATVSIEPSQTAVTPTLEITQPSCFVSSGTIKVTSAASEYSFDNGVTWGTNPIKSNLYPGDYSIMIKTVKGCTSYAQKVTIKASLLPYPYYDATQPKFCGDTGSITITSPAANYSYDNGVTWVNNSTMDNLAPGLYTIRTKDASGCISNPQGVVISSDTLGDPDFTVINPACTVSGKITINTSADFYTFDGGQTWGTTNVLDNIFTGNFSIGIKNSLGCTSYLESVYLQSFQTMYPIYETIQPTCGENGTIYIVTEADFYSFDNGVTWTTSNMKDLPAGTYIIKLKTAAGCISRETSVYLYEPRIDQPYVSVVQPTCGADGSISINTVSDFYSFDNGATWVTTPTKTLPAGSYQIKVKNSIGCMSNPQYISLYPPKIETPEVTIIQPTCTTKGTITITTPSSFYSIDGGKTWVTSNVFSNLTGNSYNVMIKNSQNCVSETKYVYFNQIYLPEPTYTAVSPSCGNIGNITFTSTADQYSIDGYNWSTNPVFNNLSAGYYYLMVKNSADCRSNSISVYLNTTNLASPTVNVVQPTCGTSGSITVTSPGTSFSFNGGSTWSTSPVLNNLSSGYYYVMVKDGNCSSTTTYVNIQQFYLPNPTYTFTNPTCGVGGTISITTPASQYSINGGQTWSTSPNFTNLADGNYNIMVQNAAGCKSSNYVSSLNLQKFYLPKPNVSVVQPTCTVKGSIKITTVASEYSFDGGQTWSTVNEKTNLNSGYYNIVIKNAQGCTSNPYEMNVSITTFYLPRPLLKVVQPSCGNNGSITVVSQAAQYSFDNGTTWVTNPSLLNPTPGYYYILIKNSAGCISQAATASVNQFYLAQPIVTIIQPTCSVPKGSIYINTIADLYSFDNGATWTTNPVKTNLNSGNYNLLIKNAAGCISQRAYVNIYNAPALPPTPVFTVTQPTACDATDGSITITTPGKSFSFNDGASWSTDPVKKNIGSGTYILKIKTNSSSCESVSVPVTLDSGINIAAPAVSVVQPTCSVSTGSITVTTTAATYSFDDGLTFIYANTKSDLLPGTYKIKIKNAAGCISYAASATVTTPAPLPSPNSAITQPDCFVSLGSIKITTAAAEYSFDNGLTYGSSDTKSNLSPGTYNLMIKDRFGCISFAGIATINQQPVTPSAPQVSVTQSSGCTNAFGTVAIISAAAYYSFDDGATWVINSSSNLSPGTYKIKIKLTASGCSSPSTTATIDPPGNAPTLPLFTVTQPTSCINPYGTIAITSTENQYSFDGGISYSSASTSSLLSPGTYVLKVKNSAGCESGGVPVTINIPADTPKKPTANIIQIDCANRFAQITINENAAQYSIDDGLTWQNSNVFPALLPHSYSLKIKNSLGCVSVSTPVVVNTFINPTPKPLVNSIQDFCLQQNATVGNISATGSGLLWYNSATATTSLALNQPLINGNTYFVTQTINSCESERALVKINIITTPPPTANHLQEFCISQAATVSNLMVTGSQIKWYSSNSGNTVLPNNTKLQDGVAYFASQTEKGCESMQRVSVTVSLVTTNIPATDFAAAAFCSDEDGTKKTDLTSYQSNVVSNSQSYTYEFFDQNDNLISDFKNYTLKTGQNIVFVKVNSAAGCSAKVTLTIKLNAAPVVNVPSSAEYCPENTVKLDAGNQPASSSFTWTFNGNPYSNQQIINVKESGIYKITVTNNLGCSTSKSVVVKKVGLPMITDIKIENNTVQIFATGIGILEYSIDGIFWQTSNLFYNLPNGNHIAFVRSGLQTCAITERFFTIFKIVNVFSPDYDGINDEWKIEGIENYPGSKIKVIDRFGTVVLEKTVNGIFSWNGEYLSRKLPTGNYWYQIILTDNRILSGYVMIKNRN